ncbi:hypothetical protein SKAU_G00080800 [Synaphobranchus kaupii]|uniref:Solute carrier family 35 member F2 n=1 Tax=Synaphobranchus kaupii TaxID=118154 RepID=A0A9Q1FUV8_SYNKA|nr:hypothetical protein SKAU_G00080800 [Synaphobranchus kaupii]
METRGPDRTPSDQGERGANAFISRLRNYKMREFLTWKLLKTMAMGQGLSLLICGTAVSSQYLAGEFHVNTPMLQSFMNYALLCLMYTTMLALRKDVEANYTVVKAYQYTTLTSVQLLDCFVIPVLMVLSWFFLKTRFHAVHYVAVGICLLGVGAMVGADLISGRDQGSTINILLGDGLVLISATLYAVSNVCQEYTVKNCSRVEFLGMVGLFGTLISGIQFFMPVVVKLSSATAVNLSLLTADLFSLFCGLFLFHYTFSGLYVVSFVVITVGFVMFNTVPTFTLAPTPNQCNNEGIPNPASNTEEDLRQESLEEYGSLNVAWTGQEQNGPVRTAEHSTKM